MRDTSRIRLYFVATCLDCTNISGCWQMEALVDFYSNVFSNFRMQITMRNRCGNVGHCRCAH